MSEGIYQARDDFTNKNHQQGEPYIYASAGSTDADEKTELLFERRHCRDGQVSKIEKTEYPGGIAGHMDKFHGDRLFFQSVLQLQKNHGAVAVQVADSGEVH